MEKSEQVSIVKLPFVRPFYEQYVDDIIITIDLNNLNVILDIFNSSHEGLQFIHKVEILMLPV